MLGRSKPLVSGLKSWGSNSFGSVANLFSDVLHITAGGFSSVHSHPALANCFVLVSGAVDILREDLTLGTCELRSPGDSCIIPANENHQFVCLRCATLVEFYLADKFVDWENPVQYDIRRLSQNGIMPERQVMEYCDGKKPRWIGYSCSDK